MTTLAVKRSVPTPLAYAIDDAIAAALADGRIAAIFATYGLTFEPPVR